MPTDTVTGAPPQPVLKPGPAQELSANPTYLEAVGAALDHEMERDPNVFIIGEDVGQFGGAFKVTKGFLDKYGSRRVVDTPIAETGFTGLAAGASLVGLRPVVEFQFADFISCAFDPIINVLARHHWRTGDPMPVTMRAPFGGRLRAGRLNPRVQRHSVSTYASSTLNDVPRNHGPPTRASSASSWSSRPPIFVSAWALTCATASGASAQRSG